MASVVFNMAMGIFDHMLLTSVVATLVTGVLWLWTRKSTQYTDRPAAALVGFAVSLAG